MFLVPRKSEGSLQGMPETLMLKDSCRIVRLRRPAGTRGEPGGHLKSTSFNLLANVIILKV